MVVFFQEVKLLIDLGQCPLDKTFISWIAKVAQNTRLLGFPFSCESLGTKALSKNGYFLGSPVLSTEVCLPEFCVPISKVHGLWVWVTVETWPLTRWFLWNEPLGCASSNTPAPRPREPHKRVRSQAGRDSLHMEDKKLTFCKPGKEVGEIPALSAPSLCLPLGRWSLSPRRSGPSNRTC